MLVRAATLFSRSPVGIRSHATLNVQLIELLHQSSRKLISQTVRNQKQAGYQPDHWRLIKLSDIPARTILQTLAKADNSLCRLEDINLNNGSYFKLPAGSSVYFSSSDAFARHHRIHPDSPGASSVDDQADHYASATQIKPDSLFGYRQHLGVFSVTKLLVRHHQLADIEVAVADVKSNPEFGKGEAMQIAVPFLLLPLIHTCCTRIISHAHVHSVKKVQSTIDPASGIIQWHFEDKTPFIENESGVICLPKQIKR